MINDETIVTLKFKSRPMPGNSLMIGCTFAPPDKHKCEKHCFKNCRHLKHLELMKMLENL